jgi:hypothetical protein
VQTAWKNLGAFSRALILSGCLSEGTGCGRLTPSSTPAIGSGLTDCRGLPVMYGRWGGGVAILVWSDTAAGRASAGSAGSPQGAQYNGRADAPDGRKIEWRCETADGKTGPVTINGQQFDLAGGPLFLVTTKGGETHVQQLRRDLSKVEPTPGDLERLAADPEVSKFLAEAQKAAEGP